MRRPVRARRRARPQRKRLFVGCEGESERGYAALLQRFADVDDLLVHVDAVLLQPGGGDPCALVERARALLGQRERRHGDPYAERFVLLDSDKVGQAPQRDARARQIAEQTGFQLIWQEPCHEAMLLRHLENCTNLRPATTPLAIQQLSQRWPEYQKGMAAMRLADRIDLSGARRVAQGDAALAALLTAIGFG